MSSYEQGNSCSIAPLFEIGEKLAPGESRTVYSRECGSKIVKKTNRGDIEVYKDDGVFGLFRTLEGTIRR